MNRLTFDEILALLDNRPEVTRTYQVPSGSIARLPLDEACEMRELTESETVEVAEYLEVRPTELRGPLKVFEVACPYCSRHITFLDFVKTAVDLGAHGKDGLRAVLTGRSGEWLTIRGCDGGRPMSCAQCGENVPRTRGCYSEYSSSDYAYA